MPSIFLLGATGFLGGSLLVTLRESFPTYPITALVRNSAHNDVILAAGASSVVNGSFEDIERLAAESDIVINMASSDDLPMTEAILRGMKTKFTEGQGVGVLLHTTGTGEFYDGRTDGKIDPEGKIWNDGVEDDIKAITAEMLHGNVDVTILKAGEEGYVNTYIICPSAISGRGTGPIGKVGIMQGVVDLQKEKGAFYVGEGSNIYPAVHFDDLMDLYVLILQKSFSDLALPNSKPTSSPYARYYIASANNVHWKDVFTVFGKVLFKHGLLDAESAKPTSISHQEAGFWGTLLGGSSRVSAVRAVQELGWKPRIVTADMFAVVAEGAIEASA